MSLTTAVRTRTRTRILSVNLVAVWVLERGTQTRRPLHVPSFHLERHNIGIPQSAGREGQESAALHTLWKTSSDHAVNDDI